MRYSAITILSACIAASVCVNAANAASETEAAQSQQASAVARDTETPALRQRITGTLVTTEPVGGIVAIDLATLTSKSIRPTNAGRSAVHSLSEPDEEGRVMLVTGVVSAERRYTVHMTNGDKEQTLFTGPGDPLWDNAISLVSLAPRGGNAAFVVQPPENDGKQFRPLLRGPLRLWDSAAGRARDLGITAIGERPSWFPDGRRFAYAAETVPTGASGSEPPEQIVRILDISTGENTLLASGHLPLVSSDGRSVLVTRGRNFELVLIDVATHTEQKIARARGLGTPIALIDGRYLIYKGRPTPGAPTGVTTNNSPLVGSKAMMAVKLMDIQTGQFVTLVPLIDPRSSATALARATPVTKQ